MGKRIYNIAIIGAGPGGLSAGLNLLKNGIKDVVIIEKKKEIGSPLRCGELTRDKFWEEAGIEYDSSFIRTKYKGVGSRKSFVISRNIFEKKMAEEFIIRGGDLLLHSFAKDVRISNKGVEIIVEREERDRIVHSKGLICADGVEAFVPRKLGFPIKRSTSNFGVCYAAEIVDPVVSKNPSIGLKIIDKYPLAFWVFPYSDNVSNVGIGIQGKFGNDVRELFNKFLQKHLSIEKPKIINEIVGVVPITTPLDPPYKDRVIVVGTSAGLIYATTAEGIIFALRSGRWAAEIFAEAVHKNDFSINTLKKYRVFIADMIKDFKQTYEKMIMFISQEV